jgi:hypothetical protein
MSAIGVYGPSGWGKSSAIRPEGAEKVLNEKETFIICPDKKDLPFRGAKKLYQKNYKDGKFDMMNSNFYDDAGATNPTTVLNLMKAIEDKRSDIKVGIIDTLSHILTHRFIERGKEKGFDKFTDFATEIYNIINFARESRITWFILFHNETGVDSQGVKMNKVRTIGKLLDEKIDIPSMFTVMLIPEVHRDDKGKSPEYVFVTQSDGTNNAKSPAGMFPYKIPNNYQLVLEYMGKYYNGDD